MVLLTRRDIFDDKSSRQFKLRYKIKLYPEDKEDSVYFWLALPPNNAYQQLQHFTQSIKPFLEYEDRSGNQILVYKTEAKKTNVILDFDLIAKKDGFGDIDRTNLHHYLINELYLEQTPWAKELAKNLSHNLKDDLAKAKAFCHYVASNFRYIYPVPKRGVANLDPQSLEGDCAEYAGLFITLCRIARIPARMQTGFFLSPEKNHVNPHVWANIYLEDLGWVDVDPQFAALEDSIDRGIELFFARRDDYRVVFCQGNNIHLKEFPKQKVVPLLPDQVDTELTDQPVFHSLQPAVILNRNLKDYDANIYFRHALDLLKILKISLIAMCLILIVLLLFLVYGKLWPKPIARSPELNFHHYYDFPYPEKIDQSMIRRSLENGSIIEVKNSLFCAETRREAVDEGWVIISSEIADDQSREKYNFYKDKYTPATTIGCEWNDESKAYDSMTVLLTHPTQIKSWLKEQNYDLSKRNKSIDVENIYNCDTVLTTNHKGVGECVLK